MSIILRAIKGDGSELYGGNGWVRSKLAYGFEIANAVTLFAVRNKIEFRRCIFEFFKRFSFKFSSTSNFIDVKFDVTRSSALPFGAT